MDELVVFVEHHAQSRDLPSVAVHWIEYAIFLITEEGNEHLTKNQSDPANLSGIFALATAIECEGMTMN